MAEAGTSGHFHWRTCDGARLHARIVRAATAASGPPALLLHSLFFDNTMFDAALERLASERDCIIPDHRGQGKSDPGRHTPTCDRLSQDMIGLCDRLGIGQVHVVGSSMGAYVGMDMLRLVPARIVSLTISCCTCDREADPKRFDALIAFLGREDRPNLAGRIASLMFGATFLQNERSRAERERWLWHFVSLPRSIGRVAAAMFAHSTYRDVLTATDTPLLAMAGAQDNAKAPSDLAWIGQSGRGRFIVLQESGHTAPVETPDAYGTEVASFLARTSATKARL